MEKQMRISTSLRRTIQGKNFYSDEVLKYAEDFITVYKSKNNECIYELDTKKMIELVDALPEYTKWCFDDNHEVVDVELLPDKLFFNNDGYIISKFLDRYVVFLHAIVDVFNIINSRMLVEFKLSIDDYQDPRLHIIDPIPTEDFKFDLREDKLDKIIGLLTSIDSKLDDKKEKEFKFVAPTINDVIPQPKEIIPSKGIQVDLNQAAANVEAINIWLTTRKASIATIVDHQVFTNEVEYTNVVNYLRNICSRCIQIIKECKTSNSIDKSVSGIRLQASEAIETLMKYLTDIKAPKSESDFMNNVVIKYITEVCSKFLNSPEFEEIKDVNSYEVINKFLCSFDKLKKEEINIVLNSSVFTLFVDALITDFNVVHFVIDKSDRSVFCNHEYTLDKPFTLQIKYFMNYSSTHINLYYKRDLITKPFIPVVTLNPKNNIKENTKESVNSETDDLKQEWDNIFKKEIADLVNYKDFNKSDYNNIIDLIEDICIANIDTILYSKYRAPKVSISDYELMDGVRAKLCALDNFLVGIDNPQINITSRVQEFYRFMCELTATFINENHSTTFFDNSDWTLIFLFLGIINYEDFKKVSKNEDDPNFVAQHKFIMYRILWFFIVDTLIKRYKVCKITSFQASSGVVVYDDKVTFVMHINKGTSSFKLNFKSFKINIPSMFVSDLVNDTTPTITDIDKEKAMKIWDKLFIDRTKDIIDPEKCQPEVYKQITDYMTRMSKAVLHVLIMNSSGKDSIIGNSSMFNDHIKGINEECKRYMASVKINSEYITKDFFNLLMSIGNSFAEKRTYFTYDSEYDKFNLIGLLLSLEDSYHYYLGVTNATPQYPLHGATDHMEMIYRSVYMFLLNTLIKEFKACNVIAMDKLPKYTENVVDDWSITQPFTLLVSATKDKFRLCFKSLITHLGLYNNMVAKYNK